MGIVIDSSILIASERGRINVDAALRAYAGEDFVLASISASEMLHGVLRAAAVEQRTRRSMMVEGVLGRYRIVDFDLAVARVHADLSAALAGRGIVIGAHDLIIAATAIHLDFRVATRDARSFPRIPRLQTLIW